MRFYSPLAFFYRCFIVMSFSFNYKPLRINIPGPTSKAVKKNVHINTWSFKSTILLPVNPAQRAKPEFML